MSEPQQRSSLYPDSEGIGSGTGVGSWHLRWKLALARLFVIELESDMKVDMDMAMQAAMGRRFKLEASLPRLTRRFQVRWRRGDSAEA